MNLTTDIQGNILSWGIAVKNPNRDNVLFYRDINLPINFNGNNYTYNGNEFILIELPQEFIDWQNSETT
jgi:hypothetical protein